jgi:hypothetical protein
LRKAVFEKNPSPFEDDLINVSDVQKNPTGKEEMLGGITGIAEAGAGQRPQKGFERFHLDDEDRRSRSPSSPPTSTGAASCTTSTFSSGPLMGLLSLPPTAALPLIIGMLSSVYGGLPPWRSCPSAPPK